MADHIGDRRLIRAAELLGDREHNVAEVMARVGLNSHSHFSKIFKDRYDCSPKEYQVRSKNMKSSRWALHPRPGDFDKNGIALKIDPIEHGQGACEGRAYEPIWQNEDRRSKG